MTNNYGKSDLEGALSNKGTGNLNCTDITIIQGNEYWKIIQKRRQFFPVSARR